MVSIGRRNQNQLLEALLPVLVAAVVARQLPRMSVRTFTEILRLLLERTV